MNNPLLDFSGLPRFDEILPEHVGPAIDVLLADGEAVVRAAELVVSPSWETFIVPLEDATEKIGRAWGQVGHLQAVRNTPELRSAFDENLPKITRFTSALGQNSKLYSQYRTLAGTREYENYNDARHKVIQNALRDFRLSGAELSVADGARFAANQLELSALSAKFSNNVLDATEAFAFYVENADQLSGLPDDVMAACRMAAASSGKSGWKLNLQMPTVFAILTYCDNRTLRELMYRANGVRASEAGPGELDNTTNIQRILQLRREQAALLGFPSYAEYSLATKMASSPNDVLSFLRELAAKALLSAKADRAELQQYAKARFDLDQLEPWDVGYVSEKLKQDRYGVSAQEVKAYFTESKVLSGLFAVIQKLYGVNIIPDTAAVWHEDVRFYRVENERGDLIGQFYLDLYARNGKRGGAWMDDCRNFRKVRNATQTPVVLLTCNFGKSADARPTTLRHDDVITLFHEMGHGLHQLLTEAGELGVAGINGVEWDAVELPSQFMENFCWEWSWLQVMSAHVETGNSIPRHIFDRMIAARNYQSGMQTVRQIEFSLFDMLAHSSEFDPVNDDVMQLLESVRDEVAVIKPPVWHRFPHAFGHVFAGGYAAGYYSYKWAEVLSADAYAAFEEASDLADVGARFRQEVLARGGSRSAAENFKAFRGRPPEISALMRQSGLAP